MVSQVSHLECRNLYKLYFLYALCGTIRIGDSAQHGESVTLGAPLPSALLFPLCASVIRQSGDSAHTDSIALKSNKIV